MQIYKAGSLVGWLIIIFFALTLANYVIKFIYRKWGKKITASPTGKKILTLLMKVLVKNHKYFGIGAFISLFIHFILQILWFGLSVSGVISAVLLIAQVVLGVNASLKKMPRKGPWFVAHRSIAILLVLGIAFHLLIPSVVSRAASIPAKSPITSTANLKVFTLDELAKYNGQNGQPAYIAYKGIVYDVSNVPQWKNGAHNGEKAGADLTNDISKSPHGEKVFSDLPRVGTLKK